MKAIASQSKLNGSIRYRWKPPKRIIRRMGLSVENISHMYEHLLLKKSFENKSKRNHITKKKEKQL
jgi:hypothetical protein